MGLNVGIDLGTTYSVVAYTDDSGNTEIIQVTDNMATTASAVFIDEDGEIEIGEDAKAIQRKKGQVATFYKRTIGRDQQDYSLEDGNCYSSVTLSSIFLKEFVKKIEARIGQKVDGAVITVPAYFTEHEKYNTRKAAEEAGINVLRMINEPTAAAIAYGLDKAENQKVMIYDLGGGTFDISIAQISRDKIEIVATIGNFQLGGKDWDEQICLDAARKYEEKYGLDFSQDIEQMDALMVDAEKLKRKLSESESGEIFIKYAGNSGSITLTEKEFRERTRGLLEETGSLIKQLFREKGFSWADIDDVILVGGSSRMRMVDDYIEELSGKRPRRGINPDEAVAIGAALVAKAIANQRKKYSLGAEVKPQYEITLDGGKQVIDVISHSMGLIVSKEEKHNNDTYRVFYNEIMIPKNTTLQKANVRKTFAVSSDTMDIYLTQCETSDLPERDQIIGKYQVFGIRPDEDFTVTYYHTPDTTVGISAEQYGRSLKVEKVQNHVDRTFEPELIKKPEGVIIIAVDLSGSMAGIADMKEVNRFIESFNMSEKSTEENRQLLILDEYLKSFTSYEETNSNDDYNKWEELSSKLWFSCIGKTKKYIRDFVDKFDLENVSFGLLGFADKNVFFCNPTNRRASIEGAVEALEISEKTGECNNAQPMDDMLDEIIRYKRNRKVDFAYTVVLTDGYWASSAEKNALRAKDRYSDENVEIVVCGFGSAKEDFIRKLATKQDLSGVGDISTIGDSMSNIARVISSDNNL